MQIISFPFIDFLFQFLVVIDYGNVRECVNCSKVTWATLDMKTREEGDIIIFCMTQGDYDGRGQPTASPMLTAIMSGGVGISGRELYKYR